MAETGTAALTGGAMQRVLKNSDVLVALGVAITLLMMIVPVWTWVLNIGLTVSIASGVVILLTVMYASKAVDFSIFPSLLLMTTAFRLALNVSSTRKILLEGKAGVTGIITAFGDFVVGGNYVVGAVIFIILVIIQMIVIVKGATRISEVAARFTLDAMPTKFMTIDQELQQGHLTAAEAEAKRTEVRREADFYGAMDGASKFVQGDVIAGLIICGVNILGGLVIGMWMRGEGLVEALQTYTLLTIGDGLAAQIPSLFISTATGLIVARAATQADLGQDLVKQLTQQPRALLISGGFLLILGTLPGMPLLPLWAVGAILGTLGRSAQVEARAAAAAKTEAAAKPAPGKKPEEVISLLQVDPMELEIGFELIPLVDPEQGGDLLDRVTLIRKQCALDHGIIVPPVRIRDNMQLKSRAYQIKIKGSLVGGHEIYPDRYMAMEAGKVREKLAGEPTREPAFGLPALWITADQRERAELAGYTVVDPPTVIATHLTDLIKRHAHELLTLQDVRKLLDSVGEANPALLEELKRREVGLGDVQKVLQRLLQEGISIRNLVTILETIADQAAVTKHPLLLTETVRAALARQITTQYLNERGVLAMLTLAPRLEEALAKAATPDGGLELHPQFYARLLEAIGEKVEGLLQQGVSAPVLGVRAGLRPHLRKLVERRAPGLAVISFNEIVQGAGVESLGLVDLEVA